jgi:hypothetical protein
MWAARKREAKKSSWPNQICVRVNTVVCRPNSQAGRNRRPRSRASPYVPRHIQVLWCRAKRFACNGHNLACKYWTCNRSFEPLMPIRSRPVQARRGFHRSRTGSRHTLISVGEQTGSGPKESRPTVAQPWLLCRTRLAPADVNGRGWNCEPGGPKGEGPGRGVPVAAIAARRFKVAARTKPTS